LLRECFRNWQAFAVSTRRSSALEGMHEEQLRALRLAKQQAAEAAAMVPAVSCARANEKYDALLVAALTGRVLLKPSQFS